MSDPTTPLVATPGQTIGPFFGYALPVAGGELLVPASHPGAVRLRGTVYDGHGDPVPDALLEIWQADAEGRASTAEGSLRRDPFEFTGFGRTPVDPAGRYTFTTVVPGATTPGRAPFVAMTVFARGLLDRLLTRVYLPLDEDALAADPFLAGVPEDRRHTLVATRDEHGFVFDVRLQGEDETVFLGHGSPA
ncbi:protocatechuate 3,4-dioxygenase subunit alpha [Marmoricola sp. Leaf446]|uniref:protocatechuate 3,4-dioxygenase subunit alpha n=1 Tax=Marmoricola sp. Leaf446 TaxID=1736379 RepID=UPI0006F9F833|nr:protocatechuate 3,4-dioxygenase subunit alpha [Marmoricola sp. Leaf446]KQT94710.1 protocatechuate 3,4-dioxygenase subunit alpha [Marmoricola sp. Leaf446]